MNTHKFILALKETKKHNEEFLEKVQNPPEDMKFLSTEPKDEDNIKAVINLLDNIVKKYEDENQW